LADGSEDNLFGLLAPGSPYVPNLLLEILISSPQNPKQIALRAATMFFIADRAMTNTAFVV
jgi:hypothetical protein